jgi:hypothetical protein
MLTPRIAPTTDELSFLRLLILHLRFGDLDVAPHRNRYPKLSENRRDSGHRAQAKYI